MPKYLYQGSYSPDGVMGLMKDTAAGRRAAVKAGIKSAGGKMECMYFSLGTDDVMAIMDLPDNIAAARLAATIAASGMVSGSLTPLLTLEEMDKALSKSANYKAPGEA
mgnify:CR=1 FL=1